MNNKEVILNQWLEKAFHDEQAFFVLLEHGKKLGLLDVVAFHAQQAVEKWLKAIIIFYDAEPPRTHNLLRLLDLASELSSQIDTETNYSLARQLNDFAVDFRYPTDEEILGTFVYPDFEVTKENLLIFKKLAYTILNSSDLNFTP